MIQDGFVENRMCGIVCVQEEYVVDFVGYGFVLLLGWGFVEFYDGCS